MYKLLICILLITIHHNGFADAYTDSVRTKLDFTLKNKESFKLEKLQRIAALKDSLPLVRGTYPAHYTLNKRITGEYEKFQIDSAIAYLEKNITLAKRAANRHGINESQIKLAGLFSSAGKYIESQNLLSQIDRQSLDSALLPLYFSTLSEFSSHYGQSSNGSGYFKRSEIYRDSLLSVLDTASLKYQITLATKMLYNGQVDAAERKFKAMLTGTPERAPERAVIAYYLGVIAKTRDELDMQIYYYSISATTDMHLSITDNASLQSLALAFYEDGDIERAYLYIQQAMADAIFSNVRYRTIESTTFYPLINASFQQKEAKEKIFLVLSLSVISVLSLLLLGGIIKVNRQKKHLKRIRKELFETNGELKLLNSDLKASNAGLLEASHIKEIYITQFFEICSSYIEKHESYRNTLYKQLLNGDTSGLKKALKTDSTLKADLDELYKNFDVIFLNLYPSFVSEFRALLAVEQKIIPPAAEFLNTELRIYALIKLGITDTTKIARFLRCSLQTVYNYRVKVRNNALDSKEDFERKVLLIGGFDKI
ncbi:DUF6377 domain-containing protein [Sphingobacterium sp. JB170]|uniref:DUF6377 domain-containing protein n=1 Tax=Sphingobacterium sp. JB170 TaxID=1434842 RepID=UPI00097EAC81|nr:DUF6377 domain-containing protein [Sphingobacterium sp. JB170]SJN28402.1 Regulatory protein SusR [Sphingobacterium sp. JB170]